MVPETSCYGLALMWEVVIDPNLEFLRRAVPDRCLSFPLKR